LRRGEVSKFPLLWNDPRLSPRGGRQRNDKGRGKDGGAEGRSKASTEFKWGKRRAMEEEKE